MANLSKALNTDMAGLAQILRKKGRGKDSVLAHITPKEAALLKARGGSGTTNPDTGLPEFDDEMAAPQELDASGTMAQQANAPFVSSGGEGTYNAPVGITGQIPEAGAANVAPVPTETYGGEVNAPSTVPFSFGQTQAGQAPTPAELQQFRSAYPAPTDVSGAMASLSTPTTTAAPTPTTPEGPSMLDKFSNYAASDKGSDTLTRMGLATALGLYGASTNRAAAAGNRAATAETQAIAAPYQQQGQNLIAQAQSGTLSPASQQAYAAAQAQLAQAKSGRGGVGAQQTANQMATLYQTLLNNQYTYGLQVAQIGDNIAVGAIKQGLAMDQQLNQSTQNFYTNLASIAAGVPPGYRQVASTAPTTPTGATP
jgi:hypothetical protein